MVKNISAQEYISRAIDLSPKTQREIALEAGYDKPNVLSMMKSGITKVPIGKIPALAKACGVDEKTMLRVIMQDYYPDVWKILISNFEGELLSDDERKMLTEYRAKKDDGFVGGPTVMAADKKVVFRSATV